MAPQAYVLNIWIPESESTLECCKNFVRLDYLDADH